jgi:hypothetical protein
MTRRVTPISCSGLSNGQKEDLPGRRTVEAPDIDTVFGKGDGAHNQAPMKSTAKTVQEYLNGLPPDRREAISAVRKVILANLPEGYQECMSYGMIGYVVPHSIYPNGYHCNPKLPLPYANLGSQKNHMALHLMTIYGDAKTEHWFRAAWERAGKKLDLGKACVRFKRLEDVPLEVVGQIIARTPVADYVERIETYFNSKSDKRTKSKGRTVKR